MMTTTVPPHVFVILGATGDLTRRKLLPALQRLRSQGLLNDECLVVGSARDTRLDDAGFRELARKCLDPASALASRSLTDLLYYQPLDRSAPDGYTKLADRLAALEKERGLPGNRAFYLAVPTNAVPAAIEDLARAGLNRSAGWSRIVVEKPFGHDLKSAEDLNRLIHRHFDESQVYRIDHYLGKETVQNLLIFRFANAIFESQWNRDHVDNVQITVAEDIGLEQRAGYYEQAGALRDMVQNHITQLLALVAMEVPSAYSPESIRYEKIKLIGSIAPIEPDGVVMGQYAPGTVGGAAAKGYREEQGVRPDSSTETFVALRLALENWRWQGVPFYVRTGKRLPRRVSQIAVTFRQPPVCLFRSIGPCDLHSNILRITIQPDEGFSLHFDVKAPGAPMTLRSLPLSFRYQEAFGPIPDAYETLVLDILTGEQTLFVDTSAVEASWRLYTPLLRGDLPVHLYPAGTWGPPEADRLLEQRGHQWHEP